MILWGVLNPILGFITIILLLISHEKDSKRAEKHEEQREIDLFITRLQYLKSIQQDHVKGLNLIKLDEKEMCHIYLKVTFSSLFY